MTEITPSLAFDRYKAALDAGLLTQGKFHVEREGRNLACALGAIDDDLDRISKCPAQVMPKWLAQHVVYFFDNQEFEDAKKWGLEFYAEIKRLNGQVPFSVVHDWKATTVAQLSFELCEKKGIDKAPHEAKQALHVRALAGDLADKDTWLSVLKPAFKAVYLSYYANAAAANADAYAAYAAAAYAYAYAAKKKYVKRLADGMVESLRRVPTPEA